MKHLIIRHFGPVEEADIYLNRINLIIGPQSSGKSTVLKVACFCDWMERQIEMTQDPDRFCNENAIVEHLLTFHKLHGYMHPDTFIAYENDAVYFEYYEKTKKWNFRWNESMRWNYRRAKIAYIPSERNIVAAIPNWYQVSMNKDNILDFMQEWEFARKSFAYGEKILDLPVKYMYNLASQGDRILLEDGKELDLTMASSGLQSLAPLFLMVRYLTTIFYSQTHANVEQKILFSNLANIVERECANLTHDRQQEIVTSILTPHHTDLFVEEPEAHIFPSTQKTFVYSLVKAMNEGSRHSCFIATHSPYIMTAFNNVILAGEKMVETEEKAQIIRNIMNGGVLSYDEVSAFEIKDGKVMSIMDRDFRLISADAIDAASDEIGKEFDLLLGL